MSDSITSRLVGEVRGNAQYHQYFGREEMLTTFTGYTGEMGGQLSYRLIEQAPAVQLSYRLQRHSRVDPVFDRWEQMLSLGWGNILKYTYKLKQFDDSMTRREDFQLVSFYQHQFNFHLRLKLWQMLLARLSYQLAFQGVRG